MSVVMTREARFRDLFEATYPVVARLGRHRGVSGQDLEDLVSATYEVAWRRFDDMPGGEEAVPWLLTVALNHLRNHRRRVLRNRGLLERLPAPEHSPAPSDPSTVSWQQIRAALEQLSSKDRDLVLLVAWDGLGPTEAAAILGLTAGAARTRLHRARGRLAELLKVDGEGNRTPLAGQLAHENAIRRSTA